jgi:Protein of unknown function (DUF3105)
VRRAAGVLAAVVVAAAAVVGLIAFLSGRDSAPVSSTPSGPGQVFADQGAGRLAPGARPSVPYNSNPPTSGAHAPTPVTRDAADLSNDQLLTALAAGNVVLFYAAAHPPPALRALAEAEAGPFDPPLAATGQAVILARRANTPGVVAAAWRHLLRTPSPSDPALKQFVEAWLGVGRDGK